MDTIELYDQFVLTRDDFTPNREWKRHPVLDFILATHPSLPVLGVLDPEGTRVGFALGWPIDSSGSMARSEIRLPFKVSEERSKNLDAFVYDFGGRYVFAFLTKDIKRLYLDPAGGLGLVYCPNRQRVGSTVTALVADEPDHPIFDGAIADFPNDRASQFYPAGLTSDPEIRRLMPNHYLDLERWTAVRHYPRSSLTPMSQNEIPDSVERISRVLRRHILAVLDSSPKTYMTLTAGRDSRMLLACARDVCQRIEFVTFDYRQLGKRRSYLADLQISKRLARKFHLKHRVLPVRRDQSQALQLNYLRRIGYACGAAKSQDFYQACREYIDLSGTWLTGFGGGVGKAPYWRSTNNDADMIPAHELLKRMRLPSSEPFQDAVSEWLSGLPGGLTPSRLNLAYLEFKVGCWSSPHLYGAAPFSMNLIPFCHREVFDAMLRFPLDYRLRKSLARDIITTIWPELLRLPFNDYTGPRLWVHRAWRKMRKRKELGT